MHFFVCLFLQKRVSGLPGFLKIADQPPSLLVNKKNNFFYFKRKLKTFLFAKYF